MNNVLVNNNGHWTAATYGDIYVHMDKTNSFVETFVFTSFSIDPYNIMEIEYDGTHYAVKYVYNGPNTTVFIKS